MSKGRRDTRLDCFVLFHTAQATSCRQATPRFAPAHRPFVSNQSQPESHQPSCSGRRSKRNSLAQTHPVQTDKPIFPQEPRPSFEVSRPYLNWWVYRPTLPPKPAKEVRDRFRKASASL